MSKQNYPARTARPIASTLSSFNDTWSMLANDGLAEDVFRHMTFTEAESIADVLLSAGYAKTAADVIHAWRANDDEWQDADEHGAVSTWLALHDELCGSQH